MKINKLSSGFTLIELLVVFSILGILAAITFGNFQTSLQKARDAERKSTLRQIASALEAYRNDFGGYPASNSGNIVACGCADAPASCQWGQTGQPYEFCRGNTVYMRTLPSDPSGGDTNYCYTSTGTTFKTYTLLENSKDADCLTTNCAATISCGGSNYNFGISSSNTTP